MLLSEIWIYPVKSLGGIRLSQAQVQERGLEYDRRWMIVDEQGMFLTQRTFAKMALLDVSLEADGLLISHRFDTADNILVPYLPYTAKPLQVTVWDDQVDAVTVSDEADHWLSRQLDKKVQIVMMPQSTMRYADPRYASNGETVSFADGFPFLLISEGSLSDLNSRLVIPIAMKRFRPNLVVSGTAPFDEDGWKRIRIASVTFAIVKPCARCVLTTIDPETGEKGTEPLKTLASYRRVASKVLFGQNLVATQSGLIKQGDEVILLS